MAGEGPKIVAVTSGKGGVGKSVIASGTAIYLAQTGRRALLVDCSFSNAAMHNLLGMGIPPGPFIPTEEAAVEKFVLRSGVPGVDLVTTLPAWHENRGSFFQRINPALIQKQVERLNYDFVIFDIGFPFSCVDFLAGVDRLLLVFTPDPSAFQSCYNLVRNLVLVRIDREMKRLGFDIDFTGPPSELLDYLESRDTRQLSPLIREFKRGFNLQPVFNQVEPEDDGPRLAFGLGWALHRFFGLCCPPAPLIARDRQIREAVLARRPLFQSALAGEGTLGIERMVTDCLLGGSA